MEPRLVVVPLVRLPPRSSLIQKSMSKDEIEFDEMQSLPGNNPLFVPFAPTPDHQPVLRLCMRIDYTDIKSYNPTLVDLLDLLDCLALR